MEKITEFLKNKQAVLHTAITILGLFMLTALLVFWKTGSNISVFATIFSGGLLYVVNGLQYRLYTKKKTMGTSMLLFGLFILFVGMAALVLF